MFVRISFVEFLFAQENRLDLAEWMLPTFASLKNINNNAQQRFSIAVFGSCVRYDLLRN